MKKLILIIVGLILLSCIVYKIKFDQSFHPAVTETSQKVFTSQSECEKETGMNCGFQSCDYAPQGKTIEEVCGKDFKKGWAGMTRK